MHKLERLVSECIEPLQATHFFVGCSGGLDSTVLVHCLHKLGKRVSIVHVNYQLRGEESEDDQVFLEAFAREKGIPFHVKRVNLSKVLAQKGGNLQDVARKIRRDYLQRFALKQSMFIALGHHADDQVETFLFNVLRGGGMMGLSAMLPVHGHLVRPLLHLTRDEIKVYANTEQLKWREDSSNQSMKYTRNRIRREWLPMITSEIPDFDQHVRYLIQHFQSTQRQLEGEIQPFIQKILKQHFLSIQSFCSFSEEQIVVLLRGLDLPISLKHQFEKLSRSEKGRYIDVTHKRWNRVYRESDHFRFVQVGPSERYQWPTIVVTPVEQLPETFSKSAIYLDPAKIKGPLQLRCWKQGDRMSIVGLTGKNGGNGSKLISDILSDAKVPSHLKDRQFVVHDDEKILWCVGFAIGKEAIATRESKIVKVEIGQL